MARVDRYLHSRREDVHDTRPWAPFAYVNRRLTELVVHLLEGAIGRGGERVLDYGCADAPYRWALPPHMRYVGADLAGNDNAEVTLGDDGTLPVEDQSFDLVMSTQVLEHVEEPAKYLSESFRVLRPGGSLVLTTHGIMYYHADPTDHWRWTWSGLTKIVEGAGFSVVELRGILGLAAAALQLFQDATYSYLPRILRPPYAFVMQSGIALADRFSSEPARMRNGLVLGIRATRPG